MSTGAPDPDSRDDEGDEATFRPSDWSALTSRIAEVREAEKEADDVRQKLDSIPHAYVLVFDVDTDDEAVYSMEVEDDQGVVLAFEARYDAEQYARSLATMEQNDPDYDEASVQALDLEALVVSSHEADFRVAMVFRGDLTVTPGGESGPTTPIIGAAGASLPPEAVTVAVTLVPENMYEGKTSADFLDPAVDTVWVLVHDAGTADAQYFSIKVNETESVVCFKTEAAALKCCRALLEKGAVLPAPREVMLDEVLDDLHAAESTDAAWDVCLVDSMSEVTEEEDEDDDEGEMETQIIVTDETDTVVGNIGNADGTGSSVAKTEAVRSMLNRLYGDGSPEDSSSAEDSSPDDEEPQER